ncbi:MAG: hypothetical protein KGL39_14025 [Patescibacteria group bacterium]|nr:hypothetical protein [Patescibacteria group bacterium]
MLETNIKVCVLWDEELRIAAQSLARVIAAQDEKSPDFVIMPKLLADALNACVAALYGIEKGDTLVVSNFPKHKRARRPS